jgi:hypothetical protein
MYIDLRDDGGNLIAVYRNADGATIPLAAGNRDYQEFLVWYNVQSPPPFPLAPTFDLARYKLRKIAAIQGKTEQLLAGGFKYAGKVFSLGLAAQAMWNAAAVKKAKAGVFPLKVGTLQGLTHALASATELDAFTDAAFDRGRAIHEPAAVMIEQVMAAQDKAAVDAIVDNRT